VEHLLRATALAEGHHFWFRGFRAFITPLIVRALADRREPRALDCGCGTGANVELVARFGRAFGFDLSAVGLQIGRQAGRTRLARATVTAAPFPDGTFDLVTSFDVLYALEESEARAALAEMFRLTRPGGYALINVAAMKALRGDHSVLGRERRRFSRSELRRLVVDSGFTIERLTYTNTTLVVPLAVLRWMQRRRGLRREEDARLEITVPVAPLNAVLTGVLLLESLWIRCFDSPFGSSLLCLARKPPSSLKSEA
jgi:SAM-dependent methyltransferase